MTHNGGDTFNEENTATLEVTIGDRRGGWLSATDDGDVSAGDRFVVGPDGDLDAELTGGETISVIWTGPDDDTSQVLGDFTVP